MARRRRAQRGKHFLRPSQFALECLENRQLLTTNFGYEQLNLASDQSGVALIQDPNLVNPFGIARANGSGDVWVANTGSNTLTRYIGAVSGSPFVSDSPTVQMPSGLQGPTGIVWNATGAFLVNTGGGSASAPFIFASQNGQLAAAPTLTASTALAEGASASGAEYTGLALASISGSNNTTTNLLYAANFAAGTISVFDTSFQSASPLVSNAFQDPNLPSGYSPYNVQTLTIGSTPLVFVTYAKQDATDHTKIAADSKGVIDVYGLDGAFKAELVATSDTHLKAPWGLAVAPSSFGDLSNDLLVANGDGTIQAYSVTLGASATPTASYVGTMNDSAGTAIHIDGLHGLAFGNSASVGNTSALFFSAGGGNGQHGLFGELINAFDTALVSEGTTLSATEGIAFTGNVAAFTPAAARAGDSFTATINWGDGTTTSAGTITSNGSGGFNVGGSHTYGVPTTSTALPVSVSIVDTTTTGGTATVSSAALVQEGNLSAAAEPVSATEGTALTSIPVATFTDPSTGATAGSYTAAIDWGDGTSASAGTITGSGGTFTISGSHTYAQDGTFNGFKVLISEGLATPTPITVTGSAVVADADTLTMVASPITATEGSTFSGQLATFTDSFTGTPASGFLATIDWGDGTTSSGQVAGANGTFTVSGSHAYQTEGSSPITVTVSDDGGTASATASTTAAVADGDVFTPTAITLGTTAGVAFSGQVAVFNDNIVSTVAGDLSATIDWGDGSTTDAGTITGGNGTFTVSGSHTYASPGGPDQVKVIISENSPGTTSGTALSTALIFDPDLTASSVSISSTEAAAIATNTTIATFTDSNASATAGDFTATINWGDGSSVTTGSVSGSNGTFTVAAGHTYADDGNYSIKVTLFETATGTAPSLTIDSTASVVDAPLTITASAINVTEGSNSSSSNVTVATFSDANVNSLSSDFTATIDWGDGTSSTGTISGGSGTFTVKGSHAYLEEGTLSLKVTVVENSSTGNTVSATAAATVAEGDVLTSQAPAALNITEGATFSGTVAIFADSNALATAAGFTAVINWGDGTTEAGTVTGSNGTLTVSGSHTYANDGFYPLTAFLVDASPGTAEGVANGTATVNEDAGFAITPATISGTEGQTFSGAVATFTDLGSTQPISHYSATIDWGDGSSSTAGSISGSNGTFTVTGSHAYSDEGPFHPIIKVMEVNSPATISATGSATMADADVLTAIGKNFSPPRGTPFTGAVATFTDTFAGAVAGDFTATIDWGDGSSTSSGTISLANGTFTVTGTHTYATSGAELVKVVIKDTHGTASATASGTATPVSSTISAVGVPVNVSTGVSVSSATVATFTDAGGAQPVGNYKATIDWGDGSTSTGTISLSGSTFSVTGSHVYAAPKQWNVSIKITPTAGTAATATTTATVGSSTERFVAQVYRDLLSREAETQGLEYWTNLIDSGNARAIEVLNILHTQEYRVNTVQGLFRLYLHRSADAAAVNFYNNLLISGATPEQISENLIGSTEYFQSRGGGASSGFLNALYTDVVHHSIDAATQASFASKNFNDPAVRSQVAAALFGSDEYLSQLVSFPQPHDSNQFADKVVHGMYQAYLGRDADAAGLNKYLGMLKSGQRDDVVAAQIIGSGEYGNRL